MIVLKFGGSSISSENGLVTIKEQVERCINSHAQVIVVVSALADVTDKLVAMCNLAASGSGEFQALLGEFKNIHYNFIERNLPPQKREAALEHANLLITKIQNILEGIFLVRDLSPKTLDFIMSFGELLSAPIVATYLEEYFLDCSQIDSRKLIKTDSNYGEAKVDLQITKHNIRTALQNPPSVSVITGYIATNDDGETTTLGRGGSDYTAALICSALNIKELEIWTVVDGIMTADPKKVSNTFTIPHVTYEEAKELCFFGAKVIYTPALEPAIDNDTVIRIKNTLNPQAPGSVVSLEEVPHNYVITGVTSFAPVNLFHLQGKSQIDTAAIGERLFGIVQREKIKLLLIANSSSERSICFCVATPLAEKVKRLIEIEFALEISNYQLNLIDHQNKFAIVAAIGSQMRHRPGIAGKMFQAFGKNGINIYAIVQGSTEHNISVVIEAKNETKALNALHDTFFLSDVTTINLFLMGVGYVGSTLLKQIAEQQQYLQKRGLKLKVNAVANSKKMHFDTSGISFANYQDCLEKSKEKIDIPVFIERIKSLNLPNTIFVDCTASEEVAENYSDILERSISIVTPNKKANSGTHDRYLELKAKAIKRNVKYFYETNVGAGLPVINTLNDLIHSGDEIIKIEAVLSGTLSYIFNSFVSGKTFTEVVQEAKAKGYTEPDPRDDLNGRDFMRKLLILARETGIPLEEKDVVIQSLLNKTCEKAKSVDEFFKLLPEMDKEYEELRSSAEKNGKVLRYIGFIENDKAGVSLQGVDAKHPFYSLSGSDNVISFTTKRYFDRPLVVKGPGAGTEVTAAGVLADIIRVASYLQ
ncbi:MAG: bifunctional aspartate kinase/homoserine dehydrogenase I [Proteobacteria bacterium]|nr:bifunctional aspartate kinase/homoserine dehydrogenase I [Pseudomonadota bacterium]